MRKPKKGRYLSEALSLGGVQKGCLNLIEAPVSSGKTYFALTKLPQLVKHQNRIVYLIDTIAGRDQIEQMNRNVRFYTPTWRKGIVQDDETHEYEAIDFETGEIAAEGNNITIMTYACFGHLAKYHPAFLDELEMVICDELHSISWMINAAYKESYQANPAQARQEGRSIPLITKITLEQLYQRGNCYVVALTATPKKVEKHFKEINYLQPEGELIRLQDYEITEYRNLEYELGKLEKGKKYMVYCSHITKLQEYTALLEEKGLRAVAVWSPYNKNHPMSEEQEAVRKHLIEKQSIREDIDVLLYNKAYETSINIRGHVDAIYIHSSDEETIIQARGRYREDLEHLFVYSQDLTNFEIPDEFLDIPLFKEDKDSLAETINIRVNGQLRKWNTIQKNLKKNGYEVVEMIRVKGKRNHTIRAKTDKGTGNVSFNGA